jgi:predicted nucleotidyltransferase
MLLISEKNFEDLITSLKSADPQKIILFGSFVKGCQNEESDIDLLIVFDEATPDSYDEKLKLKIKARQAIRKFSKIAPIDLLVYTTEEYNSIMESGSSFCRDLKQNSRILYEKAS